MPQQMRYEIITVTVNLAVFTSEPLTAPRRPHPRPEPSERGDAEAGISPQKADQLLVQAIHVVIPPEKNLSNCSIDCQSDALVAILFDSEIQDHGLISRGSAEGALP